MTLSTTSSDERVADLLEMSTKYVCYPVATMLMQAEGRSDAARFIHEAATHLGSDFWNRDKWLAWFDILDKFQRDQPEYVQRVRFNLLLEFFSMVVRTCEDLGVLLRAVDPDVSLEEARMRFYDSRDFPGLFSTYAAKDLAWYRRLLRLPSGAKLEPHLQRVLSRLVWSECRSLQLVVQDVHGFLNIHKMFLPYNTIKHGGLATPGTTAPPADQTPEWLKPFVPVAFAVYNWKDPTGTMLPIPLSRETLLRYELLLKNVRLALQNLAYQYQRTVVIGIEAVLPREPLDRAGFAAEDLPALKELYEKLGRPPLHVDMKSSPPEIKTKDFVTWVRNPPALPKLSDVEIEAALAI